VKIEAVSENTLIIRIGAVIDPVVLARVRQADQLVRKLFPAEVIDTIPSYGSLVVIYRPRLINYDSIKKGLRAEFSQLERDTINPGNRVEIPVYYDEESGADLARLAEERSLLPQDVVEIHSQQTYLVYAVGFTPGFAYLGEVDARIAAPRLATPRLTVPAGSVAIADRQTAVYPATSPGGWNLIGRTAMTLFDPCGNPVTPFAVGDQVRFSPISRDDFLQAGGEL
jgi:KipI family sensor histidine kinase inhibitor